MATVPKGLTECPFCYGNLEFIEYGMCISPGKTRSYSARIVICADCQTEFGVRPMSNKVFYLSVKPPQDAVDFIRDCTFGTAQEELSLWYDDKTREEYED